MNVVFHDVQVSCAADHIPEELVFDLTGLDIGDSIRVSDLKLPANVEAAIPAETVLATISGVSSQTEEDEAADAAVAEGAAAESAAEEGGEA